MGMDEANSLAVNGLTKGKQQQPQRLGDTLLKLLNNHLKPQSQRFAQVADAWQQLLPAELLSNCRIISLEGGRLKVAAKSPAHLFELRLCSCALMKELAVRCPRARIQSIDITIT
jgi:hypothetical protein